jgi:hypothetical protein
MSPVGERYTGEMTEAECSPARHNTTSTATADQLIHWSISW